ncbi:MAG: glycosyltransferase family 4 protein [Chlorogloeopsis fritschii C42_A2020_084]|nr:glycosyltransferase family 4 protein [Chlorogloeopsis fritschii C42_A2020_084]
MEVGSHTKFQKPTIALLPWGHVWEDFLDSIGVSLETFCEEGPGGWMLGYMHALRLAGVRTVLVLISSRTSQPMRFQHKATGATILVLPVSKSYLAIRRHMIAPYPSFGGSVEKLFGNVRGARRILFKVCKEIAPYLTTPLGLLTRELKQEGCCAIFCQEYEYFRFDACTLLGQWLHLPVFASFQGTSSDASPIARLVRPLTMQSCTGLVIGPEAEIKRVRSRYTLPDAKIAQIFNPIDLDLWKPIDRNEARAVLDLPTDAHIVVWHGRVEIQTKGLDVLLEAWEQVCRERPEQNLRLLLIGMGTDAEKLRQRLAALPNQNVVWIDHYADRLTIRCALSAGDVYAFPSRVEGFPVAPIEAMACGLPIVAAQASGIPDIVKDGEASGGIVVPCGDSVTFASALGHLLDSETLRQEWGERARQRVAEHFSLEVVGKQLRDFLLQEKTRQIE